MSKTKTKNIETVSKEGKEPYCRIKAHKKYVADRLALKEASVKAYNDIFFGYDTDKKKKTEEIIEPSKEDAAFSRLVNRIKDINAADEENVQMSVQGSITARVNDIVKQLSKLRDNG